MLITVGDTTEFLIGYYKNKFRKYAVKFLIYRTLLIGRDIGQHQFKGSILYVKEIYPYFVEHRTKITPPREH